MKNVRKIKQFFSVSPRELSMQNLTVSEIASKMDKTDENSLRLPRSFARTVSQIIKHESSEKVEVTGEKNKP